MKEFVNKLIGRLEELKTEALDKWDGGASHRAYSKAIEIVNELAEEYKGGWIPCSERLPEANMAVLVCTNANQIDVDYYGEYIKDFIGLKGTEQYAIAWQPLPQPYKENENG